jgi:hypothetical protein
MPTVDEVQLFQAVKRGQMGSILLAVLLGTLECARLEEHLKGATIILFVKVKLL